MDDPWVQSPGLVLGICYRRNRVLPTSSAYAGTLSPPHSMTVLGGGTFGRLLGLEEDMRADSSWMRLMSWEVAFSLCSPPGEDVKAWQFAVQQRALTGTWPSWHPELRLLVSRTVVQKPLGLWYSIIEAWTKAAFKEGHSNRSGCGHKTQIQEYSYLPQVSMWVPGE